MGLATNSLAYDFVSLYYRLSLSIVILHQFFLRVMSLLELGVLKNTLFSEFFSDMLWHIELNVCIWLRFTALKTKFECHQFSTIFVGVMSPLELRILEIQIFHTSLLQALIYWAEIWYMVFILWTSDHVWLSWIFVSFCRSYALFELTVLEMHIVPQCSPTYMLWHIEQTLFYCTTDQILVSSICINFCRSYAPFRTDQVQVFIFYELCPFWNLEYWKPTVSTLFT